MEKVIRKMTATDKPIIMEMMREFYNSPAVFTNGSEEIFSLDIDACTSDNPFLDGYVIDSENQILAYAMVAKSFSTEFGKPCVWIEDIFVKDLYRGQGLGADLLNFITAEYTDCIFRLEVEKENEQAVKLYKKSGFTFLPYLEMKK